MTPSPKLSIIIPTRNRRDVLISQTLPAMFGQDISPDDFEIVVVVDGSSDDTAEALRNIQPPCSLLIIERPNRGPGAARNNGIQAARGELLLFIDDDIICSQQLFRQHVEAHDGSEPSLVYGRIQIARESPSSVLKYANQAWYQKYYGHLDLQGGLKLPQDDYLISNSSFRRATLVSCGGFDEKMKAKEDYELALRLWKGGLRFKYLPQALAYEYFQKSIQYVLHNDAKAFGETDVLLSQKHPEYRRYSALAGLGKLTWWSRLRKRILAGLPVKPEGLLSFPLWICDKLCRFSSFRWASRKLLGAGRGVVELRSAAKQMGSWQALQRKFGLGLPVFLYHHVGPQSPGVIPGLTVSPEKFERQVLWLARKGYKGICPNDWHQWLTRGKDLPDKPVLFTFDDGYADLVEYALPALQRHGFGAVVFVVTGQLAGTNAWDEARGSGTLNLMSAEQILHWAEQGIEFGAHSRTHADLTTLSPDKLDEEVLGSKKDLEDLLGRHVGSFAYPFGFHTEGVVKCVRGAFDMAFDIDPQYPGLNYLVTDPHLLQRTMVQPGDSVIDVVCRTRWGHSPLQSLRAKLRLRSRFKHAARAVFHRS